MSQSKAIYPPASIYYRERTKKKRLTPPPKRIQDALLHALNSNSSNWPTQIQSHALTLLRSGEITTYPALLRRILDDVREATTSNSSSTNGKTPNGDAKKVNGSTTPSADKPNLAVPAAVVEEALRVTRESLEAVCEIDDHGAS